MVKYSKYLFVGLLLGASISSQAVFDGVRDRIRDSMVESVVAQIFFNNSNSIVEVDEKNYPELNELFSDLASKAAIKKPMFFLITKKFPWFPLKANAFAVGDKEVSAVFVGSWTVASLSQDELAGILAHEISHISKNHVMRIFKTSLGIGLASGIATSHLMQYIAMKLRGNIFASGDRELLGLMERHPVVADMLIYVIAYGISSYCTSVVSSLILASYSRKLEKEADLGAVDVTGNKKVAAGLEKLDAVYKKYVPFSMWWSSFWFNRMFATHPQTKDRIKYIEDYVPAQPVSAELAAEVAAA